MSTWYCGECEQEHLADVPHWTANNGQWHCEDDEDTYDFFRGWLTAETEGGTRQTEMEQQYAKDREAFADGYVSACEFAGQDLKEGEHE